MSKENYTDDGSFIRSSSTFEWAPGEERLMKRPKRKGFDSVVSILDEIGYYG